MDYENQNYEVNGFSEAYHVSRQTTYNEINSGRLKTYKVGRRRLISRQAAEQWQRAREAEASHDGPSKVSHNKQQKHTRAQ